MDTSLTKRITTEYPAENGSVMRSSQSGAGQPARPTLDKLAPLFQCPLCRGYLVDATKLEACNHTFCRSCIWKRFENMRMQCPCKATCKCVVCPVDGCTTTIKQNPSASLKSDTTLQDIIYKLVPGLYQSKCKFVLFRA